MTNDDLADQIGKDLPLEDTQQRQKKPFQVVLVDIKKAAHDKLIHCVKKPLDEEDLQFVALSYRWGELHETLIDTKVGYTASITSFALDDFYQLCYTMTLESDLKHTKYVWVDAICVDQHNPTRRKATIYQMSNIYDRASYILAVPDLHVAYLKGVSVKNDDTIDGSRLYSEYVYHLIHRNDSKLATIEEDFLDSIGVAKDPPELRQLLLKHTDYFTGSFMKYQKHAPDYCPMQSLDHICETTATQTHHCHQSNKWDGCSKSPIADLHLCHGPFCPLQMFDWNSHSAAYIRTGEIEKSQWKSKIIHRSTAIRQSMDFLADLIKDWSSRVWVISEFNIAKKKNNLKYWFTQLAPWYSDFLKSVCMEEEFKFFKFDFDDSSFSDAILNMPYYSNKSISKVTRSETTNPIYIRFHYTMIRQLKEQTFLEMILCSKASKNEDRFYSILPLSEFAHKKSEVSDWKINSMLSVKLKLYEIMSIKDRLVLLFWSTNKHAIKNSIFPTFATSTLHLEFQTARLIDNTPNLCNFNLDDPSTIMLQQTNNSKDDDDDDDDGELNRYCLRIKPKEYYLLAPNTILANDFYLSGIPLCKRIGINNASARTISIVFISAFQWADLKPCQGKYDHRAYCFILVGYFATKKWTILPKHTENHPGMDPFLWMHYDGDKVNNSPPVFDIY